MLIPFSKPCLSFRHVVSQYAAEPQMICNFLTCPGRDSNLVGGERWLAVSGNALDYIAVGAGLYSVRTTSNYETCFCIAQAFVSFHFQI